MKINTTALVAAAIIAVAPLTAKHHKGGMDGKKDGCCHEGKGYGDGPHQKMFEPERMQKQLSLSKDQTGKIRKINEDFRKKNEAMRAEIEPRHDSLREELMAENVDLEKIRGMMKSSSDKMIEMRMLRIQHRLEIENVLTPEQKKKWRENHREMMKKNREKRSDK